MENGRVANAGTHEELLAANGVYRELYETQFRRAIEAEGSAAERELLRITERSIEDVYTLNQDL
jgi:hypothetical protein